eukprot:403350650
MLLKQQQRAKSKSQHNPQNLGSAPRTSQLQTPYNQTNDDSLIYSGGLAQGNSSAQTIQPFLNQSQIQQQPAFSPQLYSEDASLIQSMPTDTSPDQYYYMMRKQKQGDQFKGRSVSPPTQQIKSQLKPYQQSRNQNKLQNNNLDMLHKQQTFNHQNVSNQSFLTPELQKNIQLRQFQTNNARNNTEFNPDQKQSLNHPLIKQTKNPFQARISYNSNSNSSIESIPKNQIEAQKQKQSVNVKRLSKKSGKRKSEAGSKTGRQSKSRNKAFEMNQLTLTSQDQQNIKDNSQLQEGIQVLFQKSIEQKLQNQNPFGMQNLNSERKSGIPNIKQRISGKEQQQEPVFKKSKTRKSVPKSKKQSSLSLKRTKTLVEEKVLTNIILPNPQNQNKMQVLNFKPSPHDSMEEFFQQNSFTQFQDPPQKLQNNLEFQQPSEFSPSPQEILKKGRGFQMIISFFKQYNKDKKRSYFEKWRFVSLAHRSSVQILAQSRWVNEIQSSHSESEANIQSKEFTLRKAIGCLFRYRSRKLANSFIQWKFKVQFQGYLQNYLEYKNLNLNEFQINPFELQQKQMGGIGFMQVQSDRYQREVGHKQSLSHSEVHSGTDMENICDDEDTEPISKLKKIGLIQNKTVGRTSNKDYNFKNPTAQLDQLPYQHDLFEQILQSPNKDFGRLMRLQSDSSIQGMNDNYINDLSSRRQSNYRNGTGGHQIITQLNGLQNYPLSSDHQRTLRMQNSKYIQAILLFKKKLENQVREVFRIWKSDTDTYIIKIENKIREKEQQGKLKFTELFNRMKNINDKVLIRHSQGAFNQWKLITIIDRKAENKKLQQYFMNNAKLEIQKSKVVLQKLYHQKQQYDQDQVFGQRSRSSSPNNNYPNHPGFHNQQLSPSRQSYPMSSNSLRFSNLNQQPSQSPQSYKAQSNIHTNQIMQMMNPYFQRNQHALPGRLQQMVNNQSSQIELVNQIKTMCYDMLLDILDEADKNQNSTLNKQPTSN